MKKSELYQKIVEKVCEVCEINYDHLIRGCRLQAVVDARILSVQYLRRAGLSNDDIALITLKAIGNDEHIHLEQIKKKARGIDKEFRSYSDRCLQSLSFRMMSVEIRNFFTQIMSEIDDMEMQ